MRLSRRNMLAGLGGLALGRPARATGVLRIVAAENMYGDIAKQIGGALVRVSSILDNPNQDPHMFSASPSVARALAGADIVIANGADYDPWIGPLLAAAEAPQRLVISMAALLGRKPGDNPHLWYDPAAAPALEARLVSALAAKDAANAQTYQRNGARLLAALSPVYARVAALRAKYAGTPVTATEPVFGLMARALGLAMHNHAFQLAVMNGTEPAPLQVAAFEDELRQRRVRAMFYNTQVSDDLTASLLALAQRSGVAVVGVSETEPGGMDYQSWLASGLEAVDKALSG